MVFAFAGDSTTTSAFDIKTLLLPLASERARRWRPPDPAGHARSGNCRPPLKDHITPGGTRGATGVRNRGHLPASEPSCASPALINRPPPADLTSPRSS